jgi:hypothetical protein
MATVALLDRAEPPPPGPPDVRALLGLDEGLGRGRRLLCRACDRVITDTSSRTEVAGAHEHVKRNPSGMIFRIGCFRAAPGAASWGQAVAEHTWFAGCTWQIALCGGCGTHLGWAFQGADHFHGLIVDRLRLDAEGDRP